MNDKMTTILSDDTADHCIQMETEHLLFRQWRSGDFPIYAEVYSKDETARFIGGVMERPKAWRHLASVIGHWTLRGFGVWAIEEKKTNLFVGCAGLWQPEGWPNLELPYWFLPEAYEAGLGVEAVRLVLAYAKEKFPKTQLVTYMPPESKASIAVAEAVGGQLKDTIELADFGPHHMYEHRS